jgi:hypothetical protein
MRDRKKLDITGEQGGKKESLEGHSTVEVRN